MDMVEENRLEQKMRISFFLMINRLAVTERILRRIRHGLENIAFWLLRLRNRVRCQKIWDKLSSIQCGQRQ